MTFDLKKIGKLAAYDNQIIYFTLVCYFAIIFIKLISFFVSRSMSASPPRRHAAVPMHSDDHIPRRAISPIVHQKHHRNMPLGPGEREKLSYDIRAKHERLVI